MRFLMSCRPGYGHFTPLVGLAKALAAAGHNVLFATGSPTDEMIRRDGFDVERIGLSEPEIRELRRLDPTYLHMATVPRQGRMAAFTRSFAALEVPPRLLGLRALIHRWRPDLIVFESAEFAGPLAAELEHLPSAHHSFGLLVEANVMAAAGAVAAEHWIANGLPAPDRGGMYRNLYIDLAPPRLQSPHIATVPAVQPLRPVPIELPAIEPPDWLNHLGRRRVVTVSFGTVYNERPNLLRAVIEGLRDIDADVVIATGRSVSARSLTDIPAHIQLHDWAPWASLLARTSVVVSHGGASSTLGPLAFGIPLVLIPMAADHFTNADAVSAAGAAFVLDQDNVSPDTVREAVDRAFSMAAKTAAERIAEEIREMPAPDAVVPVLVDLVRGSAT